MSRPRSIFEVTCECTATITSESRSFACPHCGRQIELRWGARPVEKIEMQYAVDMRKGEENKCQ